MRELYSKKEECTGCTACMSVCPKNAILMKEDEEGFKYPVINKELCVLCNSCIKICPLKNNKFDELKNTCKKVYAVKNVDDVVRMNSTSGGAFTAISDYVLSNNGKVYGVILDKDMNAIFTYADNVECRNKMRGSKYVQSDLKNTFSMIKEDLKDGRLTLFIGTPCQVAGIKSYLGELAKSDKLILGDIVCHGVPSPMMWREHVNFVKNIKKKKIIDYLFRDKINGWGNHTESIVFSDNTKDYRSAISQSYKDLFYGSKILRPACHYCKFTNINRIADITIGDFWGIDKSHLEFKDDKGVSLVLINSEKGQGFFNAIQQELNYIECTLSECLQPQLQYPTAMALNRDEFWKEYKEKGYKYVLKKYTVYGNRTAFNIKRIIPKSIKKFIKGIIKIKV